MPDSKGRQALWQFLNQLIVNRRGRYKAQTKNTRSRAFCRIYFLCYFAYPNL